MSKVTFFVTMDMDMDKETCHRARVGSTENPKQVLCESMYEIRNSLKKEAKEEAESPQYNVSETVDQLRSELLEKNAIIESFSIEIEKLKTELVQAQLLINEKETACIPIEPHATVRLPDNAGNSVHSNISGNGASSERTEEAAAFLGGKKMSLTTRWNKPITAYLSKEKRALTFLSKEERNKAVDLCWSDPDLLNVPRAIAGGLTLVVPEEAVHFFKSNGLRFNLSRVLSQADLTLEECRKLRKKYGM